MLLPLLSNCQTPLKDCFCVRLMPNGPACERGSITTRGLKILIGASNSAQNCFNLFICLLTNVYHDDRMWQCDLGHWKINSDITKLMIFYNYSYACNQLSSLFCLTWQLNPCLYLVLYSLVIMLQFSFSHFNIILSLFTFEVVDKG